MKKDVRESLKESCKILFLRQGHSLEESEKLAALAANPSLETQWFPAADLDELQTEHSGDWRW
jgi:hypothetical protein